MDPRFAPRRGMLLNNQIPTDTPPKRVARLVSFGVLLALVAIFGLLSLRVMSSFLLPLLLAAMLVVIFGPLHRWLRLRIVASDKGPEWIPALLTTLFVLLIVLVPLFLLVARAGGDAVRIFRAENGLKDPISSKSFTMKMVSHGSAYGIRRDTAGNKHNAFLVDSAKLRAGVGHSRDTSTRRANCR